MSQQYFEEKKIFFIKMSFLSFYLNIVCKNIVCDVGLNVDWPQGGWQWNPPDCKRTAGEQ